MNFLETRSLPCKVISIGNITAGGSGKTPTVEHLSRLLQSKGKKVGIISRGYRRNSKKTLIVTDGKTKPKTWEIFGDEPYLLAQKLDNVPIIVGKSRYEAGTKMIEKFNPDVIIMDDGFQHISLSRDLDIVLVNSKDTQDTHNLIPAGNLREPISNLSRADLVVLTKTNIHKPSDYLINIIENVKCPTINNKIELDDILINIDGELYDLEIINSKNVYIFSALGDHEGFEKTMENTRAIIVGHDKYPDHYIYTSKDLKRIESNAKKNSANFLITTEKDIVKTKDYTSKMGIYAVRMKMVFEPEVLLNKYIEEAI
jgi:tetraacyldisaccharide 4'-kinase